MEGCPTVHHTSCRGLVEVATLEVVAYSVSGAFRALSLSPSTIQYLLLGDVLPSQKKDIGPCDSTPLPLEVGVPAPKSPAKRMISWKKRVLPMHHRVANPARNSNQWTD